MKTRKSVASRIKPTAGGAVRLIVILCMISLIHHSGSGYALWLKIHEIMLTEFILVES
jgi:hypothetical protein